MDDYLIDEINSLVDKVDNQIKQELIASLGVLKNFVDETDGEASAFDEDYAPVSRLSEEGKLLNRLIFCLCRLRGDVRVKAPEWIVDWHNRAAAWILVYDLKVSADNKNPFNLP